MNRKQLIYGICSIIPFLITLIKLKRDKKKYEMREKLYLKMLEKQLDLKQENFQEEIKNLQEEAKLFEQIESKFEYSLKTTNNQTRVRKICITGGPCAGKTTGLVYLQEKLQERGFAVFLVPEAATTLFMGGGMLDLDKYSQEGKTTFQMNLMKLQMKLEYTFSVLALLCPNNKIPVLLCDRGLMDGKAYMESNDWYNMISQYNLTEFELRDLRYDAVIHLVTAADNTDCYSSLNNQARHETQQQAIEMDRKTQNAWVGHRKYVKIDNHSINSFDEKLNWLLVEVLKILSYPIETSSKERKQLYVLKQNTNIEKIKYDFQTTEIRKYYLKPKQENSSLKISQRIQNGKTQHIVKEKFFQNNTNRVIKVILKNIRKKEFEEYKKLIDPELGELHLKRSCFLYEGQYMVIDHYTLLDLFMLSVKNFNNEKIIFPPFVEFLQEEPITNVKVNGRRVASKAILLQSEQKSDVIQMYFRKLSHEEDSNKLEGKQQQNNDLPDFQLDKQSQSPPQTQIKQK